MAITRRGSDPAYRPPRLRYHSRQGYLFRGATCVTNYMIRSCGGIQKLDTHARSHLHSLYLYIVRSSIPPSHAWPGRVISGLFAQLTSVVHAIVTAAAQRQRNGFINGTLLVLLCLPEAATTVQAQVSPNVHAINMATPYSDKDFAFVRDAVGSHTIVQLGESIHLTDEFPRVRVRLVKYLHENMGFDVISLEGSQVNAWLAMERLYAAPGDTAAISEAQNVAWFPLWDTSAMRELMQYVALTQRTASPLYLSSFDMQAGQSRVTGDSVFSQLFRELARFAPAPAGAKHWEAALTAVKQCGASYSATSADSTISGIRGWVAVAAVQAAHVRPASHVAVLRMLPDNLKQLAVLCDAQRANPTFIGARQVARDSLAAVNVIALREGVSAHHKIITWGHSAHLYYNTLGGRLTSMGQRLRAADSSAVYTIGLFAGGGTSYDIADGDLIPISRRSIPDASEFSSDRVLQLVAVATGHDEYFIDLSRLNPKDYPQFFMTGVTRFEPRGKRPAILARDFDGAIYVNRISAPRLGFGGPFLVAAADVKGYWLDHMLLVALIAIVIAVMATRRIVTMIANRRR